MTKIIHPYQLLEAPQVNILNNNIVEDVNYSYENSNFERQSISSIKIVPYFIYTKAVDGGTDYDNHSKVIRNKDYNPTLYDIQDTGLGAGVNFKFDIDLSNYHISNGYNDFDISLSTDYYRIAYYVGSGDWKYDGDSDLVNSTSIEKSDSSVIFTANRKLANGSTDTMCRITLQRDIQNNKIVCSVWMLIYINGVYNKTYLTNANIEISTNVLRTENIQVDTNSNLLIQSNELIQQNTAIPLSTYTSYNITNEIVYDETVDGSYFDVYQLSFDLDTQIANHTDKPITWTSCRVEGSYDMGNGVKTIDHTLTPSNPEVDNSDYRLGIYDPYGEGVYNFDYDNRENPNANIYTRTLKITLSYTYYTQDKQQISEYIADDIKTHYADGKATISMQVVDDGTQEYDVHDIVEPRIARTELVTTIYDDPIVEQVDNFSYEVIFFNGKFRKLEDGSTSSKKKIYSSADGKKWTLDAEIDDCEYFVGVANNKLLIGRSSMVSISDDGVTFRRFAYMGKNQGLLKVTYHNGKYYFFGKGYSNYYSVLGNGIFYVNEHTTDEYVVPTLFYSMNVGGSIAVFNNILFFAPVQEFPTKIYYSTDFENILSYTTSANFGFIYGMCVSDTSIFVPISGSSGNLVYYSNDGLNWNTFSLSCDYMFYDKDINCLIARMSSYNVGAKKSFDNGATWVNYNLTNGMKGPSSTMAIGNGIILTFGDDGYGEYVPIRSVLHETSYQDVEYPLLTNADDTPKEFEITSSELVYDGLTYYNLEAVEST